MTKEAEPAAQIQRPRMGRCGDAPRRQPADGLLGLETKESLGIACLCRNQLSENHAAGPVNSVCAQMKRAGELEIDTEDTGHSATVSVRLPYNRMATSSTKMSIRDGRVASLKTAKSLPGSRRLASKWMRAEFHGMVSR